MEQVFQVLLPQMSVLYIIIAVGYLLGKFLHITSIEISKIVIYFITPSLIFFATYNVELNIATLSIPLIIISIQTLIELLILWFFKYIIQDKKIFMISFMSATSNGGYLGVPIAMMLFSPAVVSMYILAVFGKNLQESIYGVYIIARTKHSIKDSIKKMLKLPLFYAGILGFSLNYFGIQLPDIINHMDINIKHTYSIMGMLIVGLGFTKFTKNKFDFSFVIIPTIAQFAIWPFLTLGVIGIDQHYLHFLNSDIHKVLLLYSLMPVAINATALASIFSFNIEKTAFATILNNLMALVYIPMMIYFLDLI